MNFFVRYKYRIQVTITLVAEWRLRSARETFLLLCLSVNHLDGGVQPSQQAHAQPGAQSHLVWQHLGSGQQLSSQHPRPLGAAPLQLSPSQQALKFVRPFVRTRAFVRESLESVMRGAARLG